MQDEDLLRRVNLEYSQRLWSWCAGTAVPLVYASSAATYGDGAQGYTDDEGGFRLWMRFVRACLDAEEAWGPGVVCRLLHQDLVQDPEGSLRRLLAGLSASWAIDSGASMHIFDDRDVPRAGSKQPIHGVSLKTVGGERGVSHGAPVRVGELGEREERLD